MLQEEGPRLVLFTQSLLDSISPEPETSGSALEPSTACTIHPLQEGQIASPHSSPTPTPGICFWALNRCPFATGQYNWGALPVIAFHKTLKHTLHKDTDADVWFYVSFISEIWVIHTIQVLYCILNITTDGAIYLSIYLSVCLSVCHLSIYKALWFFITFFESLS